MTSWITKRNVEKRYLTILDHHAKMIIPWLWMIKDVEIHFDSVSVKVVCFGHLAHGNFITAFEEFFSHYSREHDPMPYVHKAFERGGRDCYQDRCEGADLASIGGREGFDMKGPDYVIKENKKTPGYSRSYLGGYGDMARDLYGFEWWSGWTAKEKSQAAKEAS